jgi:polyisoprenyl-teichoic acid--peptidoglycan teichoic acid transferase
MNPYIETNMTITDMLKLGALGFEAKSDGIASAQLPPTELLIEKTIRGADVIGVDKNKLHTYIQNIFDGKTNEKSTTAAKASPSPSTKAK